MDIFQKHPSCLKTPEAAKIIRNFNQLATVLVEFEILYHNGWLKQVEVAKTGMIASRVRVNFSPAYRVLRASVARLAFEREDQDSVFFLFR